MTAGESRSGDGSELVEPFLEREVRVWPGLESERPFHPRVPLWSIFQSGNHPKGAGSSGRGRCLLGTGRIGCDHCGVFFFASFGVEAGSVVEVFGDF